MNDLFWLALLWCLILCTYDVRYRRLPNALTVGGLLVFLLWQGAAGALPGLVYGIGAALLAGLFFLVPWLLKAAGGGDVKMLCAAGAAVGSKGLVSLLVLTSVSGCIMALALLLSGALSPVRLKHYLNCAVNPRYDRKTVAAQLPGRLAEEVRMPFAIPISMGTLVTLWLQGAGV